MRSTNRFEKHAKKNCDLIFRCKNSEWANSMEDNGRKWHARPDDRVLNVLLYDAVAYLRGIMTQTVAFSGVSFFIFVLRPIVITITKNGCFRRSTPFLFCSFQKNICFFFPKQYEMYRSSLLILTRIIFSPCSLLFKRFRWTRRV